MANEKNIGNENIILVRFLVWHGWVIGFHLLLLYCKVSGVISLSISKHLLNKLSPTMTGAHEDLEPLTGTPSDPTGLSSTPPRPTGLAKTGPCGVPGRLGLTSS